MRSIRQRKIRRGMRSIRQSQQSDAVADLDDAEEDAVVARESCPEKTLGVLLENHQDLLFKVLSCVMDDGLHECRRVCRRWRDACGKLPVELGSLYASRLHRVADLFPDAVSLSMGTFNSNSVAFRQALQHLSRLKNLQNLSLCIFFIQRDINSMTAALPSTDCLRSFTVSVNEKDALNDVVHGMRLLTNLETLTLDVSSFMLTDLEPVTELQGLRYLRTQLAGIINSRGELLFPSLTRLTHLELLGFHRRHEPHDPRNNTFRLQVSMFGYSSAYLRRLLF